MKYLDIENWKRKKHFEFFKKFEYPHFNICTNIDITNTFRYSQKNKMSLFRTVLYSVMKCCNEMEEFRYRIKDDKIIIHDVVNPGVASIAEEDVYTNFIIPYKPSLKDFLAEYEKAAEQAKGEIVVGEKQKGKDDLIFISSLPWVSFTSVTNPMRSGYEDSTPRIIYGKQFKQNGKIMMPFSVQVNHCLMDGIHVSKYFYKLTEVLSNPEKYFN
ncbi:MAG: CatA-like O-acetyltransferase [Ignavibacteria bacterium]